MGFYIYPDYGYGLKLDKSDIDKLCKIENVDTPYDLDDVGNYVAHYLDSSFVEGLYFTSLMRTGEYPEKCLVYPCPKQPTLFSKAYNNWKEVALDFLNMESKSLPQILPPIENEDWWSRHIGEYSYVQCG